MEDEDYEEEVDHDALDPGEVSELITEKLIFSAFENNGD